MPAPASSHPDSFSCIRTLAVQGKTYHYFSLKAAEKNGLKGIAALPFSMKVLLENLLRHENGRSVTKDDIAAFAASLTKPQDRDIAFHPARVLMQDFTGVPAVVDLAAMRDAMGALKGDMNKINPQVAVDLVIDHSVMVDAFGTPQAFRQNVELEYERNQERYQFLHWGAKNFRNFRVVPPGTGICHQVNLEHLAQTIWSSEAELNGQPVTLAYPDTLVGTDSHTTMVNGLAVLGWGVGGIEAEAAMLGQPISMRIPHVVGFELRGALPEGATATDLVLTVTEQLRAKGVVGKFVEFFGSGLDHLALEDQATIANMAPEYGATCGFFPIDEDTLSYLAATGRAPEQIALVAAYAKAQGMMRATRSPPHFADTLQLDLGDVTPSLAGPKRPQDRVALGEVAGNFDALLTAKNRSRTAQPEGAEYQLEQGAVVIAAITSCTNTSNPSVMLGAGLLAKAARKAGLTTKPWVKTSLAPGSQVVSDYLAKAGLDKELEALGFHLVGYGCTSCIGNSGPLPPPISDAIHKADMTMAAVLSGNRNFEGRISPDVRANYLASPMLVVAYALAGTMRKDLTREPLGQDKQGRDVYLKDIWPDSKQIADLVRQTVTADMFRTRYAAVFEGDARWRAIDSRGGATYAWRSDSSYIQRPPFFEDIQPEPAPLTPIADAHILALLGDSITTDHISPAGNIQAESPAGQWLQARQIAPPAFNSYGSRRGHHEVMMRGTFANIRIRNQMTPDLEGGWTRVYPGGERMTIYDAAMQYRVRQVPLVVFAGREYGTGSSRDWAAKGTRLLGVRAVIAESFERIHRSNLIGMGVLPLQFLDGASWQKLGLKGDEQVSLSGVTDALTARQEVEASVRRADGSTQTLRLLCRIDTQDELAYYRHGGILPYVLRQLAA